MAGDDGGKLVEAKARIIQFISVCTTLSEPNGSREHDNILDHQLGDREWRAVHEMVVVRSHWPCRLATEAGPRS